MANRILKYPLRPGGPIEVGIPKGSVFLSLGFQRDLNIFAWFLVSNELGELVRHRFYIAMTGEELSPTVAGWRFMGRLSAGDGAFEAHVFLEPING